MGVKAFLLAAGLGTRLRPLTQNLPKPLLPLEGVPLIFFPLAQLQAQGIEEIGINLHHCAEQIPAVLGDGASRGLRIRYFFEETLLGTGGALRNAKSFLAEAPFLLWNADTILDLDIASLTASHRRQGGIATLALSRNASVNEFGGLRHDETGRILGLAGSGTSSKSSAAVYAGAGRIEPRLLDFFDRAGETPCLLRDGVLPAIESGEPSFACFCEGYFADLGTPARYEAVGETIRAKQPPYAMWRKAQALYLRGN